MRRLLHLVAAGSFVAIGALLSGCGENDSVLFIRGVVLPEPPDCTFGAEAGGTMLVSGTVDETMTESYQAVLLVGNQITRQGSRDQLRTETSRVSILGAEVHVLDEGDSEIDSFTVTASGQIDPGSGQEPGYGVVSTTLLSGLGGLGRQVISKVQVYGQTLGGKDVESNWFRFPIEIVSGGLIADNCDMVQTTDERTTCWRGQDFPSCP
ncbi:MAG: hypothetical protein JW940_31685 [Polyangiaceae bacterium]|nr:hypothetical protein [Polyangiaceae bacterium]